MLFARLLLFPLALTLFPVDAPNPSPPLNPPMSISLFAFDETKEPQWTVVNLTGHTALELRVRGNGRQFEVELDDATRGYGHNVSRRAGFATSAEWTVVRVPFSALRSTIFGQLVDAPPIDLRRIQSVGLYMADGKDGAFSLEVDYIRAVGDEGRSTGRD